MSNRLTITGVVVAEPELVQVTDRFEVLRFPLYDNDQRKNRDTGEWEDTGNVTKLRVELKFDLKDEWQDVIHKGDVLEVSASITEREYTRQDQTTGRSLETTYVSEIKQIKAASSAPKPSRAQEEDPWG